MMHASGYIRNIKHYISGGQQEDIKAEIPVVDW